MKNTALIAASEVKPGDTVCERDGYAFTVLASEFNAGKYTFTLQPVLDGPGSSNQPRKCTVKRSASVRVVSA